MSLKVVHHFGARKPTTVESKIAALPAAEADNADRYGGMARDASAVGSHHKAEGPATRAELRIATLDDDTSSMQRVPELCRSSGASLAPKGTLVGSPFKTAAAAIQTAQSLCGADQRSAVLITRRGQGFDAFLYRDEHKVAVANLSKAGLPLGAATGAPQTWLVAGAADVGQLVKLKDGAYAIDAVNPTMVGEPRAVPGAGLPVVVPTAQINHSKNVEFSPALAFRPSADIDELSAVMRFVQSSLPEGTKVKAGGSLHAYSDVAASNAVFVHPEHMKGIAALPDKGAALDTLAAHVDNETREHLVEVVSGTTVRELNEALWDDGLAIPNLGGFDGQTVGGVLATGTHGSVLARGPMHQMVQASTFVLADGTKLRLEPSHGISDPERFSAQHPDIELIQDDAQFQASLVHNGSLGIVHSHVLAVTDAFYLNEVRTKTDYETVKATLQDGGVYQLFEGNAKSTDVGFEGHPQDNFHLEVWFNPHSDQAVITSRNKVELPREPTDLSERPGRNLIKGLQLGDKFTRPMLPTWLTENFPDLVGGTTSAVARIAPEATPWLMDQALNILPDAQYTQRSYNVFNIGDGQNAIPALASTLFVPLRDDLFLRALDILRDTAKSFADHGKYQPGPISLRFVGGSDAALTSSEDVASFEIIFAEGTDHAPEMIEAYYRAVRDALGDDVRYHWGQFSPGLEASEVAASFPEVKTLQKLQRMLDPGRQFLNETQERLFPES